MGLRGLIGFNRLNTHENKKNINQQFLPYSTLASRRQSFTTGRLSEGEAVVRTRQLRTRPSLPVATSSTRPMHHWERGRLFSATMTRSPTAKSLLCVSHFDLRLRVPRYSFDHRLQNSHVSCCTVSQGLHSSSPRG